MKSDRARRGTGDLSRRQFFKLGAVAAGAGAATVLLDTAARPGKAEAAQNVSFTVDIAGSPIASSAVTEISVDPVGFKSRKTKPGKPLFANARIVGSLEEPAAEDEIRAWTQTATSGQCLRKDITIELRDPASSAPVRTFNLLECSPVSFSFTDISSGGSSGAVRTWTLEVRVNRVEMA